MSFFEPPPSTPTGFAPAAVMRPPAWLGPPLDVLPGVVPVELVIARSDQTVVAVTGMRAYPTGFGFTLSLRRRHLPDRQQHQFPFLFDYDPSEGHPTPDEFPRFGVQFADGRKATNLDRHPLTDGEEPVPPVLTQGSGGGGGQIWDMEQWVWPLPPPGPVAFVCEWPAGGIAESRTEIDARSILEAAERAVTLWPDDHGSRRG
jgi:hypothetical protein